MGLKSPFIHNRQFEPLNVEIYKDLYGKPFKRDWVATELFSSYKSF